MEKVTRLPPGFRFHPTDEELVVQYLKKKVLASPLPASIIPEVDHVCNSDPWDLPGDSMGQERYFFSTRESKYPNCNRSNRATSSGCWKATGIDKQILTYSSSPKSKCVVGMKKTLVFYRGRPLHGVRTDWVMHEYRIDDQFQGNCPVSNVQKGNWVLCRIFFKNRGTTLTKKDNALKKTESCVVDKVPQDVASTNNKPLLYEFMLKKNVTDLNVAPSSPSTDSSGITDVSSNQSEEDNTSSTNSICTIQRRKALK